MSRVESIAPERHTTKKRATLLLGGAGLLLGTIIGVVILFATGVWHVGAPEMHGIVMQSPQPVANFTLMGAGETPVSLRDFRGKVVLLYFGYTYCPDVCPATMVELKQAMETLGKEADEVQVLMVSVDPERDTPESLQEYVSYFHPSFIGLTGTESEVLAAATPLGVFFEKSEGTAATGYLIDHTATVLAIDKKGYLRLVYPFGTTGNDIAADLHEIIND